jgi:hypothetical protein
MKNTKNEKERNVHVISCNLLGYFIAEEQMERQYKKWLITEIDEYGMMTGTDINEFGHIQTLFIHKNNKRVEEVVMLNCN